MTTARNRVVIVGLALVFLGFDLLCSGCGASTRRAWHPAQVEELLERGRADQEVRSIDFASLSNAERNDAAERMKTVDRENAAWLEEQVSDSGWPTSTKVGPEAANAAFLIVQHADHAPEFQSAMLPQLKRAASDGSIPAMQVAYLTDRVRVAQARPQLYGTQYYVRKNAAGAAITDAQGRIQYILPIVENTSILDQRRMEMGLGPWSEYEAKMASSQQRPQAESPQPWDGRLPVDPQAH